MKMKREREEKLNKHATLASFLFNFDHVHTLILNNYK